MPRSDLENVDRNDGRHNRRSSVTFLAFPERGKRKSVRKREKIEKEKRRETEGKFETERDEKQPVNEMMTH